jgi:hypothetical protein
MVDMATKEEMELRRDLERMFTQLQQERTSFDAHWRDLNDYILPRRGRFFIQDVNEGDRRTSNILDCAGTLAAKTLIAGMMGSITSPSKEWFHVDTRERYLKEDLEVQVWLDDVTQILSDIYHKSNFYQSMQILYGDSSTFGTGAMFVDRDDEDMVNFSVFPVGSYYLSRGKGGKINTFAREFRMTVREIVETFGDEVSDYVIDRYKRKQYDDWIDVRMMIMPNKQFTPGGLTSKPYTVVYWETGNASMQGGTSVYSPQVSGVAGKILRIGGYDVFPVLAFRWSVTGEDIYGTDCPGMTALPDIKQLQSMVSKLDLALEKMIDPTLVGPSILKRLGVTQMPGETNFIDELTGRPGLRPLHEVDPRVAEVVARINQLVNRINNVYHVPLFMGTTYSDRREVTAREIDERHEEKLMALGTVLDRLNTDVLDPLIDITFEYALKAGKIPPPPPVLAGRDLKVEYISIMAQAQKAGHLNSFERYLNFIGAVAKTNENPEALDTVDWDKLLREYADIIGLPPSALRSQDDVDAIRTDRQQAIAARQQMEMLEQGARATRDAAQAPMDEDNALTRALAAAQERAAGAA